MKNYCGIKFLVFSLFIIKLVGKVSEFLVNINGGSVKVIFLVVVGGVIVIFFKMEFC